MAWRTGRGFIVSGESTYAAQPSLRVLLARGCRFRRQARQYYILNELGIRYWHDVYDLTAGRMETQIDRAFRLNPTVLLVLSENSVESDCVEWEAVKARELEKGLGRDVRCPVALDDAWKRSSWPGTLRRQIEAYHILDFSGWRDAAAFEGQFAKLLDGLRFFYGPNKS